MKKKLPPLIDDDGEVRELTREDFRNARPLREVDPALAEWSLKRQRAKKGEAKKQSIQIRLSPDVVAYFKSRGPGWQTRIDRALQAFVEAAK